MKKIFVLLILASGCGQPLPTLPVSPPPPTESYVLYTDCTLDINNPNCSCTVTQELYKGKMETVKRCFLP